MAGIPTDSLSSPHSPASPVPAANGQQQASNVQQPHHVAGNAPVNLDEFLEFYGAEMARQQQEQRAFLNDVTIAHVDSPAALDDSNENSGQPYESATYSRQSSFGLSDPIANLQLRSNRSSSRQDTEHSAETSPQTQHSLLLSAPTREWHLARGYLDPQQIDRSSLSWLRYIQPQQTALVRRFTADLNDGLLSVKAHSNLPGRRGVQFLELADPDTDKITYQFQYRGNRWALTEIEFDKRVSGNQRQVNQHRAQDVSIPNPKWFLLPGELRLRVLEYVAEDPNSLPTLRSLSETNLELSKLSNPHQLIATARNLEEAVHETKRFATYGRLMQHFDPRRKSALPPLQAVQGANMPIAGVPIRMEELTDVQRTEGLAALAKHAAIGPFWMLDEQVPAAEHVDELEQAFVREEACAEAAIFHRVSDLVDICRSGELSAKAQAYILLSLTESDTDPGIINPQCLDSVKRAANELLNDHPEQHLAVMVGLAKCAAVFDDENVSLAHFAEITHHIATDPRYTLEQRVDGLAGIARSIGKVESTPPARVVDLVDNILVAAQQVNLPPDEQAEVAKGVATTLGRWDDNFTAFERLWEDAMSFPNPDHAQSIARELLTQSKRSYFDGLAGHAFGEAVRRLKDDANRGNADVSAMLNTILETLPGAEATIYRVSEAAILQQLIEIAGMLPSDRHGISIVRIVQSIPHFATAERPYASEWHSVDRDVLDLFKSVSVEALFKLNSRQRLNVFAELCHALSSLPKGNSKSFDAIRNRAECKEDPNLPKITVPDRVGRLYDRIGAATWMLDVGANPLNNAAWPANKIAFDLILSDACQEGSLDEQQKADVLAGLACALNAVPSTVRTQCLRQLLDTAEALSIEYRQAAKQRIRAVAPPNTVQMLPS